MLVDCLSNLILKHFDKRFEMNKVTRQYVLAACAQRNIAGFSAILAPVVSAYELQAKM